MKTIFTVLFAMSISGSVFAGNLNDEALKTLLSSEVVLTGDVHSYETLGSIYQNALNNNAQIKNECEQVAGAKTANCILWLTFSPLGETALEYTINLPGNTLASKVVSVSRGD